MNALTCGIPSPENRAGHFTLLGFCMIATNSAGPLLAGWLFDTVDYRTGFAILAALVLVLAGTAVWLLRGLSTRHEDYA
jgi:MFS family permease